MSLLLCCCRRRGSGRSFLHSQQHYLQHVVLRGGFAGPDFELAGGLVDEHFYAGDDLRSALFRELGAGPLKLQISTPEGCGVLYKVRGRRSRKASVYFCCPAQFTTTVIGGWLTLPFGKSHRNRCPSLSGTMKPLILKSD